MSGVVGGWGFGGGGGGQEMEGQRRTSRKATEGEPRKIHIYC